MSSKNRTTATSKGGRDSATADGDETIDSRLESAAGDSGHAVRKAPTYEAPFGDGATVKSIIGTAWGDSEDAADSTDDPKAVIDEVWADLTS